MLPNISFTYFYQKLGVILQYPTINLEVSALLSTTKSSERDKNDKYGKLYDSRGGYCRGSTEWSRVRQKLCTLHVVKLLLHRAEAKNNKTKQTKNIS